MTEPVSAAALAIAKPLVSKVVESLLKPVISIGRGAIDPIVDLLGNRFSEYLERQLIKHSYLPTMVFQIRQPLEDIYIPLTVCEENLSGPKNRNATFKLDHYVHSFVPKTKRVLLIDSAGMGKTTASRFLFIEAIKSLATVPIFIELRHLSNNKIIIDHVLSELNPSTSDSSNLKIDKRQLVRLLEKGIFTFFLDGYDEINNLSREQVTRDIKDLTDTYPLNNFIITSRPEHALASFPAFQAFRIVPLEKHEAFELIRKYDRGGEKGERLIARLQDATLPEVDNFLENPLLTTLLYRAYDYKAQIPLKKPNFYRQVFDALFEWHDLTKDGYSTRDKVCKLDIDGFHKILRGIGFVSVLNGKVETDTDEMLKWIRESKTYAPELRFSESDFLEDAIKAVPIFRREGSAIIWSHKSLSEYFCAQFIVSDAKADQSRICEHLSQSFDLPGYFNVLDLLYDMDIVLFGTQFIKPFLKFYQSEVVRLINLYPDIPEEKVELRVASSIGMMPFFLDEDRKMLSTEIKNRLKSISETALQVWFNTQAHFENQSLIDSRLQINSQHYDKYRILSVSHPLRTVFDVLVRKKHPIVLLRALYPDYFTRGKVVGLKSMNSLRINETQTAACNNSKNFSHTTSALAQSSLGIINAKHVEFTLREIDQMSSRSQTTAALLQNLNISKSQ